MAKQKMVFFPGATSKDILQCLDVHLTSSSVDTVILHVRVNDLLEDNSQSKIENRGKNLKSIVGKYHTYGIKNSGIKNLFQACLHNKNRSTSSWEDSWNDSTSLL